jgi:hypothetical protein
MRTRITKANMSESQMRLAEEIRDQLFVFPEVNAYVDEKDCEEYDLLEQIINVNVRINRLHRMFRLCIEVCEEDRYYAPIRYMSYYDLINCLDKLYYDLENLKCRYRALVLESMGHGGFAA